MSPVQIHGLKGWGASLGPLLRSALVTLVFPDQERIIQGFDRAGLWQHVHDPRRLIYLHQHEESARYQGFWVGQGEGLRQLICFWRMLTAFCSCLG